jgi:hypothetical protein
VRSLPQTGFKKCGRANIVEGTRKALRERGVLRCRVCNKTGGAPVQCMGQNCYAAGAPPWLACPAGPSRVPCEYPSVGSGIVRPVVACVSGVVRVPTGRGRMPVTQGERRALPLCSAPYVREGHAVANAQRADGAVLPAARQARELAAVDSAARTRPRRSFRCARADSV